MDRLKKFNLEIRNARQMYTTALLTMSADGKHCVTVVPSSLLAFVCYQAAVYSGAWQHVALLNVSDVVAMWHSECAEIIEPVKAVIRGFAKTSRQIEIERNTAKRIAQANRMTLYQWELYVEAGESHSRPEDW